MERPGFRRILRRAARTHAERNDLAAGAGGCELRQPHGDSGAADAGSTAYTSTTDAAHRCSTDCRSTYGSQADDATAARRQGNGCQAECSTALVPGQMPHDLYL